MAKGTDSSYPIREFKKPDPLPDVMKGSPIYQFLSGGEKIITGYTEIRPNDPAPQREPVKDCRPGKLLEDAGFESAEEWGNSILAKKDGFPSGSREDLASY